MTRDSHDTTHSTTPDDTSDQGSHLPAQKGMKQFAKQSSSMDEGDASPGARQEQAQRQQRRLTEGDKPVGESDHDGSSPYEEPHHRVKNERDR